MARRTDIARTSFEASSVCLCMARHSKKRSQHSCLDCRGGRTDLAGNQRNRLYRSPSLSYWIVLAEGTRPQPIQTEIKTGSRRLYCLSERDWSTEMIQARKQPIEHCQMGWPGKFLFRSHMLMPFPGNYHVPDSIDWCSSSCPSLADPRSAKKRRTEWTCVRDAEDRLWKV
jgi:hypothetical protein